ncbi:MAG TPA: PIN domain-containing protein [Anaerolineae bacterium]|nr:PIN domain-containing protein [Anaerolineae bacterium]
MRPRVFLDTSALLAGLASPRGASNKILALAEAGLLTLVVSEQVLVEAERNLEEKLPRGIPQCRRFLITCPLEKVPAPSASDVAMAKEMIHAKDVSILVAAMNAQVDYLVTLNRKHFLDDPEVARRSGLRIGAPEDLLAWLRAQLEG